MTEQTDPSSLAEQLPSPTPAEVEQAMASRLGMAIAKAALPQSHNLWFDTAPPEKDVKDKLTQAIEQVIALDTDVNLALYEKIRQVTEWREFFTPDWHRENGYHYTIDTQLDNANGSVTYLSMEFFAQLAYEEEIPENLDEYDPDPFIPRPTHDVVRMVCARRFGLPRDANAQTIIQTLLERGGAVRIVNYTAEEAALLRDTAEDSSDPNIFRLTTGHRRKVVVDGEGKLVEMPDVVFRDVNTFVEPKSTDKTAMQFADNLIATSKRRAAEEAAEKITRKAEYKALQWKQAFGGLDDDGAFLMQSIEEANGVPEGYRKPEEIVVGRNELVVKGIRAHELERWDDGVVTAIRRNLLREIEMKYITGSQWWQDLTPYSDNTEFARLEQQLGTKLQAFFDMYSDTPEATKELVRKYSHLAIEQ